MLSVVRNEVRVEKKTLKYPSFNNVFGFVSDIFKYDSILVVTRERDFFHIGASNIYGVYKVGYDIYGSDSNLKVPLQVCFSVSYKNNKILVPFKDKFFYYKWDKDVDFSWRYFGERLMVGVSYFNDIIVFHKKLRKDNRLFDKKEAESIIKCCSGNLVELKKEEVTPYEIVNEVNSVVNNKIGLSIPDAYKRLGDKIGFAI